MMAEFKWISLFLTAVLQFPAAAETLPLSFTVRAGDEVTLPCEHVIDGQRKCENTTWNFVRSGYRTFVELFENGQIGEKAKSKSDRLRVTENCSLVIKKVTDEDVGRYNCQQFKPGQQQASDSQVLLSVVTMDERQDTDEVTLYCSVSTYGQCGEVKWLYEGKDVNENNDMKTSQAGCQATVSFLDSHFSHKSKSNFKCEVTDIYSKKVQQFTFSRQSSGEKTGDAQTTTTITTTTTTTENTKSVTATTTNGPPTEGSLWLIIVSVGVAALLITVLIVVGLIRWKKTKGKKPQMDENAGRSLNPAVSPETSQDTADPEDGVSYASISYTRKTNSKGRVLGKDGDDEDDAVTYSTVKASSSSAGASADPSDLYATIR